jgi:dienelactone hydrolase
MNDKTVNASNTVTQSTKSKQTRKIIGAILLLIVIGSIIYGGIWFMASYEPDMLSLIAMQSSEKVTVEETDDYISFMPAVGEFEPGLLYYPGAKVEPEAYAVMAQHLAEAGIPVIIAKMPFNFAVFDTDKAMALKSTLGIEDTWAIGGHSLGGSMAAKVAYDNPNAFDALILFASYPAGKSNDLSTRELNVLSISGSYDAFVTKEKIDAKKPFLPVQTIYYDIEGGNHSQFGNYGLQKGDNLASISSEAQMNQIVEVVIAFMGGLK